MSRFKNRMTGAIRETAVDSVTDDEINTWAFRNLMRRLSDKEHDDRCKTRFAGMTPEEIKDEIRGDILLGKEP